MTNTENEVQVSRHYHIDGKVNQTYLHSFGLPRGLVKNDLLEIGKEYGLHSVASGVMESEDGTNILMIVPCDLQDCVLGISKEAWDFFM